MRKLMTPLVTPLLVGTLALMVAACSSDGDTDNSPTTTLGDDVSADVTDAPDATAAPATTDAPDGGETATEGDAFCIAAKVADQAGNVDFVGATPEQLRVQIDESIDAGKAALALAPADIEDVATKLVSFQERLSALFEKYDYDLDAIGTSTDGQALLSDPELSSVGEQLDQYLAEKCGIPAD